MRLPYAGDELVVVMLHLSLGRQSRQRQLAYVAEQVAHERQVIIMGDMNTPMTQLLNDSPLKVLDLQASHQICPTYPAWEPALALDHVLVSSNLVINDYQVLNCRVSDHLPIAVEVTARGRAAALTSSCPKYAVFCGRAIEGRKPESKSVVFYAQQKPAR